MPDDEYIKRFEREAEETAQQVREWEELPWIKRHGPTIACVTAVVGTLLLLGLGMRH